MADIYFHYNGRRLRIDVKSFWIYFGRVKVARVPHDGRRKASPLQKEAFTALRNANLKASKPPAPWPVKQASFKFT